MKKLLSILFIFFALQSFAQGNLQFNQVLTYSGSLTVSTGPWGGNSADGPQWVVPVNKVWKIENKTRTPNGWLNFLINGNTITDFYERTNAYNYSAIAIDNSPIWLKANDVIKFNISGTCPNGNGCTVNGNYSISIIEYNIVP